MHVEFLVNDGLCLILSPQNSLEEELLKTLAKQNNTIQAARSGITVFNRTLPNALMIGSKDILEPTKRDDSKKDEEV